MAIHFSSNPAADMLSFALDWYEALASGDVRAALSRIDHPSSYGFVWSEVELHRALTEFGAAGLSSFTAPSKIGSEPVRADSGAFDDGAGYWFDCPVPIDGVWSDLTAQFEFTPTGDKYAVRLQDLHVL